MEDENSSMEFEEVYSNTYLTQTATSLHKTYYSINTSMLCKKLSSTPTSNANLESLWRIIGLFSMTKATKKQKLKSSINTVQNSRTISKK